MTGWGSFADVCCTGKREGCVLLVEDRAFLQSAFAAYQAMAGLHPDKIYKVTELNRIDNQPLDYEGKAFSGAYLMANGLEMPYNHKVDYHKLSDYSSRVLYLEEVK